MMKITARGWLSSANVNKETPTIAEWITAGANGSGSLIKDTIRYHIGAIGNLDSMQWFNLVETEIVEVGDNWYFKEQIKIYEDFKINLK